MHTITYAHNHMHKFLLLLMILQYTQRITEIMYIKLIGQHALKAEGNKCQQLEGQGN